MKEKEKKKAVRKKERNVLKEQEGFEEENRLKKENLLFYNGYGGFTNEGSEYKFMVNYKKKGLLLYGVIYWQMKNLEA